MSTLTIYDPNAPVRIIEQDHDPDLEQLQLLVGGLIEIVYIPGNADLVINEEGKLIGAPYNKTASDLYKEHLLPGDYIVGVAVHVTPKMR